MGITRWSTLNQTDYFLCKQRQRSSIQSAKARLGADLARIMNSLLPNSYLNRRKYGKTTRPFRYDINQIPYDYTVEVRTRFKAVDLIECLMNYGRRFMTLYRGDQDHPQEKQMQKSKMVV